MEKSDISLGLMAGVDIPVEELKLVCHSPTITEIAYFGESKFFTAMQFLCLEKEAFSQDETVLQTLNNFQILMKVLEQSQDKTIKTSLITLLMMLFPKCKSVVFMPRSINFLADDETVMVDEDNFAILQSVIREVLCVNSLFQKDNIVYKPANDAARKIAKKIYEGRRKIAQIKSKQNKKVSVLVRYISILMVSGKSLQECVSYNLFQLFDQVERYMAYIEWDTDLKYRLAGGKPEKEVESYMRELHSDD